ncbi:MAG: glycosyltransferase family 4 protein [bacterium]
MTLRKLGIQVLFIMGWEGKMKITYLLWGIGHFGGVKMVFEYADRLIARGHDVSIVTHFGDYPDWYPLKAKLIKLPPYSNDFPKSDVIMATYWPTAYEVDQLKADKKIYYVQGKEESFYTDSERIETVKNTFRLSLKPITISSWLAEYLRNGFGLDPFVIPNGIDTSIFKFQNVEKLERRKKTLNLVYVTTGYGRIKGVQDALAAFCMVKKQRKMFGLINNRKKNLKITFVTTEKTPPIGAYGCIDQFVSNPSQEKLIEIYNQGDIFVHASIIEGFALPPLEAMACGNAVIATDSMGVREYCVPGHNCLLLPPREPVELSKAISQLIENDELRTKLACNGIETVGRHDWDKSLDKLEKVFQG